MLTALSINVKVPEHINFDVYKWLVWSSPENDKLEKSSSVWHCLLFNVCRWNNALPDFGLRVLLTPVCLLAKCNPDFCIRPSTLNSLLLSRKYVIGNSLCLLTRGSPPWSQEMMSLICMDCYPQEKLWALFVSASNRPCNVWSTPSVGVLLQISPGFAKEFRPSWKSVWIHQCILLLLYWTCVKYVWAVFSSENVHLRCFGQERNGCYRKLMKIAWRQTSGAAVYSFPGVYPLVIA